APCESGAQVDGTERSGLVIELRPLRSVPGPYRRTVDPVAPLVDVVAQRRGARHGLERRARWVLPERGAVEERAVRVGGVAGDRGGVPLHERVQIERGAAGDRKDLAAPRILRDDGALLVAERVLGRALELRVEREHNVAARHRGGLRERLDRPLVRLHDAKAEPVPPAALVVEPGLETRVLLADEVAGLDPARGLRLRLIVVALA